MALFAAALPPRRLGAGGRRSVPVPPGRSARAALLTIATIAALFAIALGPPAAGAEAPHYKGASSDGEVVFFTATEQLVPGDTDGKRDVYSRSFDPSVGEGGEYVTREISTGPIGGNDAYDASFEKVSADGTKVFFTTAEPLVAADADRREDVYVRNLTTGTVSLVSVGQGACEAGCGNPSDAGFAGAAAGGDEVFFQTAERLVAADEDSAVDLYERDPAGGTTTLVSAGEAACAPACGNEEVTATLRGVSGNGNRAFFATTEPLSGADVDTALDIYARDLPNGPTELASRGDPACSPCGNDSEKPAVFAGSSADGGRVFFETSEGLVEGDGNGVNDVYERAGGATTLVSAGDQPATFKAVSEAGDRVLFATSAPLAGGDTNEATDVYRWSGGAPSLVTSGTCAQGVEFECGSTFKAAAADATKVLFTTTEQLDAADTDSSADVYEQEVGAGAPTLVSAGASSCSPSCGNEPVSAIFNDASGDGSTVFVSSDEQLAPQDEDSNTDVYVRDLTGSATTLASPGGVCPITPGGCDARFAGAFGDGLHVFFQTEERLAPEDVDSETDVYERDRSVSPAVTRLISTGNSPDLELGPATPVLTGTDPESPGEATEPKILGQADPNTSIKLYTTAGCSGAPAAVGTAAELESPGIAVAVVAGSTTSFRATATDEAGETSGCSGKVEYKQESAPPPPPPPPPPGSEETGGGSGTGTGGGSDSGTGTQPKTYGDGIAYVTPEARITFGPGFKTRKRKVLFRFVDATWQPGSSFICKLDRRRWRSCGSPLRLRRLRRGRHVFRVKAVNAVGAWGPKPAKRRFKVVR